jgi:hypothetical protein
MLLLDPHSFPFGHFSLPHNCQLFKFHPQSVTFTRGIVALRSEGWGWEVEPIQFLCRTVGFVRIWIANDFKLWNLGIDGMGILNYQITMMSSLYHLSIDSSETSEITRQGMWLQWLIAVSLSFKVPHIPSMAKPKLVKSDKYDW